MSAPANIVLIVLHMGLQDLALTLRSTGAAEQLEIIEAERDKLAAVSTFQGGRQYHFNGILPFVSTSCASLPCSASYGKIAAQQKKPTAGFHGSGDKQESVLPGVNPAGRMFCPRPITFAVHPGTPTPFEGMPQQGVSAPALCMIADRKKILPHWPQTLAQMTVTVHAQHIAIIDAISL